MADYLYAYSKDKPHRQYLLGEIQAKFNMSLVIDGTKDSCKVVIINNVKNKCEPNTIVYHQNTMTWWVVEHDRMTAYYSENNKRIYKHELELVGALELLNSRDLTDCGFNQKRYNIGNFVNRLFSLSNFEFSIVIREQENLSLDKLVDYLKTFENYTLASALREFFNGYNCDVKLEFSPYSSGGYYQLGNNAYLRIISRVGDFNQSVIDISEFNDARETEIIDKNSFGTTVVSNAENVISTQTKTFPTNGSVKMSADSYEITTTNGLLRLPSNAFKVNYVDFVREDMPITIYVTGQERTKIRYNPKNDNSMSSAYDRVVSWLRTNVSGSIANEFEQSFSEEELKEYGVYRLYETNNYDPVNDTFESANPIIQRYVDALAGFHYLTLAEKSVRDCTKYKEGVIYYERGKDTISGFEMFNSLTKELHIRKTNEKIIYSGSYNYESIYITVGNSQYDSNLSQVVVGTQILLQTALSFVINYVPMSDIKIKLDNTNERNDIQLYNQNGKLTDSNSLSKSLLSYAKEIQSDTITRYKSFKDYSQVIGVGRVVDNNGVLYVINNVSLDMSQSENEKYFVQGEYTMAKYISVKSLMVNPNTNIRDYGIPQNNNVKRKQLYRDFYELDYLGLDNESPYLTLDKVLNLGNEYRAYQSHTGVIKLTFNNLIGTPESENWYYQLESTTFILKKSVIEMIDFKDNNIIGYGNQNVWCGFDITRVFSNMLDTINTPISYVDDNGEFKGIDIAFCTNEQLTTIYNEYEDYEKQSITPTPTWNGSLYNYSVFIDSAIYEGKEYNGLGETLVGAKDNCDFVISEPNYNKDALEVPVIEYMAQIDDSENVIVGENILDMKESDLGYLYGYVLAPKNSCNENNYLNYLQDNLTVNAGVIRLKQFITFEYDNSGKEINIKLWENGYYNISTKEITYDTQVDLSDIDFDLYDLCLFRYTIGDAIIDFTTVGELINLQVYSVEPSTTNNLGKYYIDSNNNYYKCEYDWDFRINNAITIYSENEKDALDPQDFYLKGAITYYEERPETIVADYHLTTTQVCNGDDTSTFPSYGTTGHYIIAYKEWRPNNFRYRLWRWTGSTYVETSITPNVNDIYELLTSGTYYKWNSNSYKLYEYTPPTIRTYYYMFSNGATWDTPIPLVNGMIAIDEVYNRQWTWGDYVWRLSNVLEWIYQDSADDLYFSYNNATYQYDANIQQFTLASESSSTHENNLMFVLRNIDKDNTYIQNNNYIKLFINNYKLR